MMNFFKNSFHSMLPIPNSENRQTRIFPPPDRNGLLLLIESPIGSATKPDKSTDPASWGLLESSNTAGKLLLCTESLGSESCDTGIEINSPDTSETDIETRKPKRSSRTQKSNIRYPPPLTWMTDNGKRRTRFLKAERTNGRIVLTEIRINLQPDTLRAIRTDGRLRLQLVDFNGSLDGEETEDNGERWELPRVRNESQRCVEAVSGDCNTPIWWSHRFMTTA